MEIETAAETTATIPANGSQKLTWPVTVDTDGATVIVTMTARAETGGLADAVEITLPVYRYSTPEVVGTSGQVGPGETRLESILVPANAEPDRGGLDVMVEPSLAAGMRGGLSYLEHYPYECVEQTMSRFLPNVATYLALSELGIERPGLKAQLEQEVSVGLQKIYGKQHIDGGWGWWQTDDSNVVVSAYVIFGLAKAREAGFAVDSTVLNRGTQFLTAEPQVAGEPEQLAGEPAGLRGLRAGRSGRRRAEPGGRALRAARETESVRRGVSRTGARQDRGRCGPGARGDVAGRSLRGGHRLSDLNPLGRGLRRLS